MRYVIYCHYKHWVLAIWYIQVKQVKEQVQTHIKLCRNEGGMGQPGQRYLTATRKVWIFGYGQNFSLSS